VIWRRDPLPPLDLERREREQALARQTRLNVRPLERPDPDNWGFNDWTLGEAQPGAAPAARDPSPACHARAARAARHDPGGGPSPASLRAGGP
jgi:hypothetical protein